MPTVKTIICCSISAVVSYADFALADRLAGVPEVVLVLIPGLAFYLALDRSVGRPVTLAWRIVMAIVVTAGWYLAYRYAEKNSDPLYVAGVVAGAIGGAALFVLLLPHPARRTLANAALLTVAGAVIGAIALPAGFLFGEPKNLNYVILTFLPWQVGMGLIVTGQLNRLLAGKPDHA